MSTAPDNTDADAGSDTDEPEAVLAAVDRLLLAGGDRAGRRTAVRLLRLAVERAVDEAWVAAGRPELTRVARRAQFLLLAHAARDTAARDTAAHDTPTRDAAAGDNPPRGDPAGDDAARGNAARDAAREASATWAALSAGCDHHAYELTPTAAEATDLRARTAGCLAGLARAAIGRPQVVTARRPGDRRTTW